MTDDTEGQRPRDEETTLRHAAWAGLDHNINEIFKSAITFSTEAIKASMLVSGGSAAALLALFSQVVKDGGLKPLLPSLLYGLALFSGALFLSSVSAGVAYLSQAKFAEEPALRAKIANYPWVIDTDGSKRALRWGNFYRAISIAFVIASYFLTAIGYGLVYCGFQRYIAL